MLRNRIGFKQRSPCSCTALTSAETSHERDCEASLQRRRRWVRIGEYPLRRNFLGRPTALRLMLLLGSEGSSPSRRSGIPKRRYRVLRGGESRASRDPHNDKPNLLFVILSAGPPSTPGAWAVLWRPANAFSSVVPHRLGSGVQVAKLLRYRMPHHCWPARHDRSMVWIRPILMSLSSTAGGGSRVFRSLVGRSL